MGLYDIGWAIFQMKQGEAVYREIWLNPDLYIFIPKDKPIDIDRELIMMKQADWEIAPWIPMPGDLLAEDWAIFVLD